MKKRILNIIALILTLVIALSVTSCQPGNQTDNTPTQQTPLIPRPEPTPEKYTGTAVRYEAEDFVGGKQDCPWASEGGFIGSFDSSNKSSISFTVNCSDDATVKLVFCVANTSNKTIFFENWKGFLKINNVSYNFDEDDILHDRNIAKGETYADKYPAFASTAPYLMFDTVEVEIELNRGYNTITFTGGSVTFNFDYIEIVPENNKVRVS